MTLARFAAGRALSGAIFALAVASLSLLLAHAMADDTLADDPLASPEARAARRAELGLDRPWYETYGQWVTGLVQLDLGQSSRFRRPVRDLLGERALNTLLLAVCALLVATALGVPLGRLAGVDPRGAGRVVRAASLAVLSVPPLIGALALVFIAARTGWLPSGGMTSRGGLTGAAWAADVLRHLPVPVLALALPMAATLERLQARAMLEALARPFVAASRARGLDAAAAARVHAWPVSLAPVVGTYGVLVGGLFSGSFIVEIVTAWPGLGRLMFDAIGARDMWLVAGCGGAAAVALAVGTSIADVVHAAIDPRVLEARRS